MQPGKQRLVVPLLKTSLKHSICCRGPIAACSQEKNVRHRRESFHRPDVLNYGTQAARQLRTIRRTLHQCRSSKDKSFVTSEVYIGLREVNEWEESSTRS